MAKGPIHPNSPARKAYAKAWTQVHLYVQSPPQKMKQGQPKYSVSSINKHISFWECKKVMSLYNVDFDIC